MIRILATGDFQIDKSFSTLGKYSSKFNQQLINTFTEVIVEHAPNHDLVLIAGDLFDRAESHTRVIQSIGDILAKCPTTCVILPGNHDPVNSGIPGVLSSYLEGMGANHIHVSLNRKPIILDNHNCTIFPGTFYSKDDISDMTEGVTKRVPEDGIRIGLFHGVLNILPNGKISPDLAKNKDLDIVVCGDQHGPSDGNEEDSELFSIEVSRKRKLFYSMAPEPMHINQNFNGKYTRIELSEKGKILDAERIDVGKIRFINDTIQFNDVNLDGLQAINDVFDREDIFPELTSIRLVLQGYISIDMIENLDSLIQSLRLEWPLLEVIDDDLVRESEDEGQLDDTNPTYRILKEKIVNSNSSSAVKERALKLLKINLDRWI